MRTLIISLFSAILLSGCMHNNGDIGDYFGTWKVTLISVDGDVDGDYSANIFFQFQSDVVRIVENRSNYEITEYFGTWVDNGNNIIIDLNHKVNPESEVYHIPEVMRMVKGENFIKVSNKNSSKMTWTFESGGQTITFTLNKQ